MTTDRRLAKPPTMRQVAQHAGVDVSVVSRLLSGDPRLSVSEATKQRVLAAVRLLDYRPNLAARALRTSRGGMAAFVVPEFTSPVYSRVIAGAHRRATEEGYSIVVGEVTEDLGRLAQDYRVRGVDGMLLAGATLSDEAVRALGDAAVPVVVVNRLVPGTRRTAVVDYTGATELAADHLRDLGHRDVVVVAGPRHLDTTRDRVQAFTRRATANGARVRQVTARDLSGDAGLAAGQRLLSRNRDATAVFAPTLMLAVGVLAAAHRAGVSVPDELSIIALHDAELAKFTWPPLTTVSLPMTELGAAAVDHLLAVLSGADPEPSIVTTPPELVVRGSTGPPR
ncbi:LacI family DNA-binding transcriptional regulator [Micromonospora sp. NPDC047074]|uniref:LacI family DNA-binding transcriptional regulator n=1 Tax=Micromonospora sp. NPDC047074 TaxID=3154339 RepID=UPI0033F22178